MRVGSRMTSLIAVTALTAALIAGCSSSNTTAEPSPSIDSPSPSPTSTPSPTPSPTPEVLPTWPLTGTPDSDVIDRPVVAVKIENSDKSRPQSGLAQADVVWVQTVEGGVTRFNAWFHSSYPEEVGPVRSVRLTDAYISGSLQGIQVFSGGRPEFVSAVRKTGLQTFDEDSAGFYRTKNRKMPYNLYGDVTVWAAAAKASNSHSPQPQLVFATEDVVATAVISGVATTGLDLRYPAAHSSWTWDAQAGRWLRFEKGKPHLIAQGIQKGSKDKVTGGDQVSATNVVVLTVPTKYVKGKDASGSRIPVQELKGTGKATVATAGKSVEATWSKVDQTSPLVLTTVEGQSIVLAPGNTWVEMIPTGSLKGRYTVQSAAADATP